MTLFRGYGGDLPLMRWLREKIWPVEAKLEPEDVYWGTRLACAEMIRTGTTRFWDMYWHPARERAAVRDAGLRATIGGPLFDADGGTAAMQATALESLEALAGFGPEVAASLAPHSIYTVSEELLRWTAELAAEREIAGADPPLRDRGRGEGVPRAARAAPSRLPRPARPARRAHRSRPRRLARPGRAGADRRARLHGRRQPGRQHEARGRRRLPLPRGTGGRRRRRPRHRRPRLQRLPRPALRPQALRPLPAPRQRRPDRPAAREAWAIATGAAAPQLAANCIKFCPADREIDAVRVEGQSAASGGPADFLLLRARSRRAEPWRSVLRSGLCGKRVDRRYDRGRGAGADAGRRGAWTSRRSWRGRWSGPGGSGIG